MDDIGSSMLSYILAENIRMLKDNGSVSGKLPNGYVLVDIDVTPFDNFKTKKQGVSRTYKGCDGYAPIMTYIGTESYLVNCELWEGKQQFLRETIRMCREITDEPLLIRLDSGNDAAEDTGILIETGCYFIIKRNLCKERMAQENAGMWKRPMRGKPSTSAATGSLFPIKRGSERKKLSPSVLGMRLLTVP